MELQGSTTSGMSDASAELRSAKLSKELQERQGEQTLQLLDSATGVPPTSASDPALGSQIDTFA